MKTFRILVLMGFLGLVVVGAAVAHNQFRPWDHDVNPALLAPNQRRWVELAVTPVDFSVSNSVVAAGDVFQEKVVIDFNEINERVPDEGWRFVGNFSGATHGTVHIGPIGFGGYTSVTNMTRFTLPKSLVEIMADGLPREEDGDGAVRADGEGALDQRLFLEGGLYGSYTRNQIVYALKLGAYSPVVYSRDTNFGYELYMGDEPNDDGNYIDLRAGAEGEILLGVDPDDPGASPAVGLKTDVGFIRQDSDRRALFGAAINNVPIVPAQAEYRLKEDVEFRVSTDREEGLSAFFGEEDEEFDDIFDVQEPDLDDPEVEKLEDPVRVFTEPSVSGFYRFGFPVVDVIPHAEVVFGSLARLNAGAVVEGNLPVLNWLSVGFGYDDFAWEASAGLRIPLRVIELSAKLGYSAPEISGLFRGQGFTGSINIAIGL